MESNLAAYNKLDNANTLRPSNFPCDYITHRNSCTWVKRNMYRDVCDSTVCNGQIKCDVWTAYINKM